LEVMCLNQWFQPGVATAVGVTCRFSEVARASDKNLHNFFYI